MTKYAVLDTDFIEKAFITKTDDSHHLIDLVMRLQEYNFYCHEKTVEELYKNSKDDSPKWLKKHIATGKIKCYSDRKILTIISSKFEDATYSIYSDFLKLSCDADKIGYFNNYFAELTSLKSKVTVDDFLEVLASCESRIGDGESLGEKKSSVLLQLLQLLFPNQVYVFCSDDKNARRSIMNIPNSNIKCISMLSLFCELKKIGYGKMDVEPYFDSYETFCNSASQDSFRVWVSDRVPPRKIAVPMRQVFDDIFEERFVTLSNGDLKYRFMS